MNEAVLYEFRLHVGKSTIPKAGLGAFLTFLGAHELSFVPKEWEGGDDEPKQLVALHPDGFDVAVTLEGEFLGSKSKAVRAAREGDWVGFGGRHNFASYKRNDEMVFASNINDCSLLPLGLYGPLLKEGTFRLEEGCFCLCLTSASSFVQIEKESFCSI